MAVTSFNTLADGTWGPEVDANGVYTYQITMEAFTNDAGDTGDSVLATQNLPIQYVTKHPSNPLARVMTARAKQDENDHTYWVLTYGYSTSIRVLAQSSGAPAGGGSPSSPGAGNSTPTHSVNPLDRRPKISLKTKSYKKPIFKSLVGTPITNAAGELFEATTIEVQRLLIDVRRNILDFTYEYLNLMTGSMNALTFLGFDPFRVKCEMLEATEHFENEQFYWEIHGQFIVGTAADILDAAYPAAWWSEWKLNAGFHYLNGGVLTPCLVNGQRPSRPLLLAADGSLLNGTGRYVAGGADPIYYPFKVLDEYDFNLLGLFN